MDERGSTGSETVAVRVGEDRAAKILERAAALDAKRSSEIEVDQLRDAAAAAGISRDAFDQAMAELSSEGQADGASTALQKGGRGRPVRQAPSISGPDFAHYTAVLRDLLGDEGQVTVVEDRIEWQDEDGVIVSLRPGESGTTAAVSAEGRLRGRLLAVFLPILLPLLFTFVLAFDEDEFIIGFMIFLLGAIASMLGTWFHHRRERKALRKKVERIRRQLQRLLNPPGPDHV